MIFPVVNFVRYFDGEDFLVFHKGGLVNLLSGGELRLPESNAYQNLSFRADDGAVLQQLYGDHGAGEMDLHVFFKDREKVFDSFNPLSFGDGWLIAVSILSGAENYYVAYNYMEDRSLIFADSDGRDIYFSDGLFFLVGWSSWEIFDSFGELVVSHEIYRGESFPSTMLRFKKICDFAYLNVGFIGGCNCFKIFSFSQCKFVGEERWGKFVLGCVEFGSEYFFVDSGGLYLLDRRALAASRQLAVFPEQAAGPSGKGNLWLWTDHEVVYVASAAGCWIHAYAADGRLIHEVRIPDGWRPFSGGGVNPAFHADQNFVFLAPIESGEWGYGGILAWKKGFLSSDSLVFEEIESVVVQRLVGDGVSYHITCQDRVAEKLVRHAIYNLSRIINDVASGMMNRGKVVDAEFNGLLELVLINPERKALEELCVKYLSELMRQKKSRPQWYGSSDKRKPLALRVYWKESVESEASLIIGDI